MQGPGTFSNIFAHAVVVSGPLGTPVGIFVYPVGTVAGPGNSPIAWATNQLADFYGNALPSNATIGSLSSGVFASLHGGFAQFGAFPAGSTSPGKIGLNGIAGGDLALLSGTQSGTDTQAVVDLRSAQSVSGTLPHFELSNTTLDIKTAGHGVRVAEGSNAKQGTATLAAGTVTIANTAVTANSRIFLTAQDNNSTGTLRVSARVAGTSFTITSSNAADTGVVAYEIFEPG